MQLTATKETSRTGDAAKIARKMLGDLQSLRRNYGFRDDEYVRKLASDIEVGFANECINKVQFKLSQPATNKIEVIEYDVTDAESIEASAHSGRFPFEERLKGCQFNVVVTLEDREKWEALKKEKALKLGWSPCEDMDLKGLSSSPDGAYVTDTISVSRTKYSN